MKKIGGLVVFLAIAFSFVRCDIAQQPGQKSVGDTTSTNKQSAMPGDTTMLSEFQTLPDTEKLKEGKTEIENRLNAVVALIEKKEASLYEREKALLDREKMLYAKSASLDERMDRLKVFRTVSWFLCAIGVVTLVFGIVFFQRSRGEMVKPNPVITKTPNQSPAAKAKEKAELMKSKFITAAEVEIEGWQNQVNQLKTKTEKAKEDVKEEYNKQIIDLEKKLASYKTKLDEAKKSGNDTWESLKQGIETAKKDITKSVDDAAKKIK